MGSSSRKRRLGPGPTVNAAEEEGRSCRRVRPRRVGSDVALHEAVTVRAPFERGARRSPDPRGVSGERQGRPSLVPEAVGQVRHDLEGRPDVGPNSAVVTTRTRAAVLSLGEAGSFGSAVGQQLVLTSVRPPASKRASNGASTVPGGQWGGQQGGEVAAAGRQ